MRYVDFALRDADEHYRSVLEKLYVGWQDLHERFFESRLRVPHLTIAAGPPQALGLFKSLTDYGGRTQITVDARILSGRRRFVLKPWPYEGVVRFVHDIVLHEMVHQYLAEVEHYEDGENAKHGEGFADVCNRIGRKLGLARVYTRRRSRDDAGKPLAVHWPVNARPADFYMGHVIPPGGKRPPRPAKLRGIAGVISLCRHLLDTGRADVVTRLIQSESERPLEPPSLTSCRLERGEGGYFDRQWLKRNGGLGQKILDVVITYWATDQMPLLALALQEGGCSDELLLGHCRLPHRHSRDCWALRAMRSA